MWNLRCSLKVFSEVIWAFAMTEVPQWQRPRHLSFPTIYYKFVAGDKNGNKLVEYKVADIPEERYEEACRFMVKHFVPSEPKLVARNAINDPDVLEDYFNKYMHGIQQKISVACYRRGSPEFVGINILEVLGRNDNSYGYVMKSQTCRDNIEATDYVVEQADIFNRYNVDYYLSGTGLAVDSDYRGKGIATEMIKARERMLEYFHLKVTSTGFSSIAAQRAALKAGYVSDCNITYEELSKLNPNWDFRGTESKSYDQMSLTI